MSPPPFLTLPPVLFSEAFPFHFVFNADLDIVQVGAVLQRLNPVPLLGSRLDEQFQIEHPKIALDFEAIRQRSRSFFILKSRHSKIQLKGQMLWAESQAAIYFLGALRVTAIEELKPLGVKLKDFAIHDPIADFLFLLQAQNTALADAKTLAARLTERQIELENSLETQKALQQQAEAANRAKSEFLANMSHELRTPLNAILGFAQILLRGNLSPQEQVDYVNIINRSGEHLLTLINDILEMSKIEAGRLHLNTTTFDLFYLLASLTEIFRFKAESKGLNFEVLRSRDVPQYIETDEGKLRQVLINLLNNAIKFTQKGHIILRICLQTCENSSSSNILLQCSIEDTGLGIAAEEMFVIFEPFLQSDSGLKSQEGTGLGLPISQKFVRLLGGEIEVKSEVNRGSTFSFFIPVLAAKTTDIKGVAVPSKVLGLAPQQSIPRILVVEDNAINRQLLVKLLTSVGLDIREAENGQEAIALWEEWQPHLIWMDMRMPVLNGYEATKAIKSHLQGQATVIIALTASAWEEERSLILSIGCDDFIRKPFHEAELFSKMEQYLGLRYLYEEEPSQGEITAESCEVTNEQLLSELQQMPCEWKESLKQAAIRGFDDRILQLSQQIPETYPTLKAALGEWADNFDFDAALALLRQLKNRS